MRLPPKNPLNLTRLGWGLALAVLFLTTVGVSTIHATEASRRPAPQIDPVTQEPIQPAGILGRALTIIGPVTLKQLAFIVSGVVLMLAAMLPSYQRIGRYAYLIYWLVIIALALLVVDRFIDLPFIPVRRSVRRWIEVGPFALQPSEFMKLALVLVLARYLRFRKSYRRWLGLIPPFLLTLLPMALILKQPDLGTLLMLLPVLFALLFVAGARIRHLATIVLLGCATLPVFYFFGMKDYQRQRIQVLFKQEIESETWHLGPGYQLRQAKMALGSGGVFGEGYGEGAFLREEFLPEGHNDFIFAVIGNQWGIVGCSLVIAAYILIVILGLEVAGTTNDPFGRLLCIGVVVMIVMQALLNMCMPVGLAPITGMTLPFVSAGGSSMWTNFLGLGLILNVARRRPMLIAHPPFEHRDD